MPRTRLLQRFDCLEQQIEQHRGHEIHAEWLDEYLEIGLELASQSAVPTTDITRLYTTLQRSAMNTQADKHWRKICLDHLYQPFFVLKQLYCNDPKRYASLRSLLNDFSRLNRCLFHEVDTPTIAAANH